MRKMDVTVKAVAFLMSKWVCLRKMIAKENGLLTKKNDLKVKSVVGEDNDLNVKVLSSKKLIVKE